ncbi:MAG: PKD domain-containing protein [Candidatus Omnitrophica bacterium]|nr:PKD domain-containing protein [Candidatus Omnitrophota bacterium]MBU1923087.1 PKD domain-containing protein [Candidatus Omnitrophota bacterium]
MKKICIVLFCLSFLKIIYAQEEISSSIKVCFSPNIRSCVNRAVSFYANVEPENAAGLLWVKWDFGDGTQAQGRDVNKIYSNPGIYLVKLTAYDKSSGEAICSAQNDVRVDSPPQASAGEDIIVCSGKSVVLDGSRSKVTSLIERCLNCSPLTYTWSFGDGTPDVQGAKVRHTYAAPGNYKATLTVYDGKAKNCPISTDSVLVLVNTKPELVFREVKSTCVGKNINFAVFLNASDGRSPKKNALIYTWDFGDGAVIKGPAAVTHAYKKGGEYLVKVTADDQLGTGCSTNTQVMKVKINTPPVADTGPNLVCCANVESIFDGSTSFDLDGDTLSYIWDFGDGQTAKGAQVTHVYKKRGKYKVILKVDDNSGTECSSSTDRLEVSVSEKPVSKIKIY